MLKQIGFGLLILLIISYAINPLPEVFERPWENEYKWPGNSSIVDYTYAPPLAPGWNPREIGKSLESLGLDEITEPYSEDTNVRNAKEGYIKAENARQKMEEFAISGVLPYFMNIESICDIHGLTNCSCGFIGSVFSCDVPYGRSIRYWIAMRLFSTDYSDGWIRAMDYSLNALQASASRMNKALWNLENTYNEAKYSGICEQDVSGYEACENVSNFMYAVQANSTAPEYVQFTRIREVLIDNAQKVHEDVPMIEVGWVINALGNSTSGEIGKVTKLEAGVAAHLDKTKSNYIMLLREADNELKNADVAKTNAERHELWRIRASPAFSDIVGDDYVGVSEAFKRGTVRLSAAYSNRSASEYVYTYQDVGYLRDALRYAYKAQTLAREAKEDFLKAQSDGEALTSNYEARAQADIEKTRLKFGSGVWPLKAKVLYDSAVREINSGRNENKIGLKFEHYVSAINYAREAYLVSPMDEKDTNWTVNVFCGKANEIIRKAKIDGVDVSNEEAMLAVLEKSENVSELIFICEEIVRSITESARYKYAELNGLRAEAVRLLDLCGSDCDDLRNIMANAETGLVSQGMILYPEAIGSLKTLREKYTYVKEKSGESLSLQVGRYLIVRQAFFADNVMLDEVSKVTLRVDVTNPIEYRGENVVVEIKSPIVFDQGDVVFGADKLRGVAYLNGKLKIYLRSIDANDNQVFEFAKNITTLKTKNIEKHAFGSEDGSARIEEIRNVISESSISGFYVPVFWNTLTIDGLPVVLDGGYARTPISEGQHTLKSVYTVQNAYTQEIYSNSSNLVGHRTYQKYQIKLDPNISMDYAQSLVAIPQSPYVKEKHAITLTGERIGSVEIPDGLLVTIHNIKEGKEVKFEVSYYVDNSTEYINAEIAELDAQNLSNETKEIVDNAKDALAQNDITKAIWLIGLAHEQIKNEQILSAKLQKKRDLIYGLVSAELERIERVLEAEPRTNALTEKLSARKIFLRGLLDSLVGKPLDGQVLELKKYDADWLATQLRVYKKNVSNDINALYVRYLNLGYESVEISENFLEVWKYYNKFEASTSLEDAYELATIFSVLKDRVIELEQKIISSNAVIVNESNNIIRKINTILKKYGREYAEAKGSRFEVVFTITPNEVKDILVKAEKVLVKNNNNISKIYDELVGLHNNISAGLDYLKASAITNSERASTAIKLNSGRLSEKDYKKINTLETNMNAHITGEEWVKALKTSDDILKILSSFENNQDYGWIVWISAAFIVAVIIVYYYKGKHSGKNKKPLRKLEKAV